MIDWKLFRLTPRDQASDWLRVFNVSQAFGSGLASNSYDTLIEGERLVVITHFGVEANGLTQPYRGHVTSLDPKTATIPPHDRSFYFGFNFLTNAVDNFGNFQTPLYIPVQPGHILRTVIVFTGAGANNGIISFGGFSMPKGNVSS